MLLGEMVVHFQQQLKPLLGDPEAGAVTARVFEHHLSVTRIELVLQHQQPLDPSKEIALLESLRRLLTGEPVQYVLGTAPFMGLDLEVTPSVLIPRPETEELVHWILTETNGISSGTLVDFGTGSGCIPIAFAKQRNGWKVTGLDISPSALSVADRNAKRLEADVNFLLFDMLAYDAVTAFLPASLSVMVSNPPYIPMEESDALPESVRDFEPPAALFTLENDPLQYYRALHRLAAVVLIPGGSLFLEVHERYARETLRLFQEESFTQAEMRFDLSGKARMIRVKKSSFS